MTKEKCLHKFAGITCRYCGIVAIDEPTATIWNMMRFALLYSSKPEQLRRKLASNVTSTRSTDSNAPRK